MKKLALISTCSPRLGTAQRLAPSAARILDRASRLVAVIIALGLALGGVAAAQAPVRITLDDAIKLALEHSPALLATRTQIQQSQAQEVTANLRPNPVLAWDSQFIPLFQPSQLSWDYLTDQAQWDLGVSYLFERGKKRQHRLQAARDQTAVTRAQVLDAQRSLTFNVAQQFISVLLAESNLQFAQDALSSYQQTVDISNQRYKAGDISQGDLLKIQLQLLQFQTDVSSAQVARVQALASLRELLGYEAVPDNFEVSGDLNYQPLQLNLDDLKALALRSRPDLQAAQLGVAAANSGLALAQANGKKDLDTTFNYTRVSGINTGTFFFNIQMPVFDRNQGEIARNRFLVAQSQYNNTAASEIVLTDVTNAYQAVRTNDQVLKLYVSGYLDQARQSRDISEYAFQHGAASLLDLLDAERSYRSTQLAYRQALAQYMVSVEQLRQAVGTRQLP